MIDFDPQSLDPETETSREGLSDDDEGAGSQKAPSLRKLPLVVLAFKVLPWRVAEPNVNKILRNS